MHYIGIDLGGTSIKGAVVTEGGTILKEASCPTQRESGPEHVAREISGLITALAEGYDPQAIGGVGVGCPGIVEDHSGIVRYSANLHWENFDLRAAVQKYSGYTVRLANDANAAALGEVVAGCAQNVDSAVILTLGTGVGSGVVLNGKILTGCTGGAAELGHMVVEDGGAPCACGRKGCFEAYASATGLIRMAKEAMAQHPESLLHATAAEVGEVNGRTIFQAKEQGHRRRRGGSVHPLPLRGHRQHHQLFLSRGGGSLRRHRQSGRGAAGSPAGSRCAPGLWQSVFADSHPHPRLYAGLPRRDHRRGHAAHCPMTA